MKKVLLLFLILAAFTTVLSACGKENDTDDTEDLTPTASGQNATPTAGVTAAATPTAEPSPTATPEASPTPGVPGAPDLPAKYTPESVVKMMEDEIPTIEYAYKEVTDYPLIQTEYYELKDMTVWNPDSRKLETGDFIAEIKYNHRVCYYDADLQACTICYLQDDRQVLATYTTQYGRVMDCDGYRYYDISIKETDDAGRTVLQMFGFSDYYCMSYDENGHRTGNYFYLDNALSTYELLTYDDAGRVSTYTYYYKAEDTDTLPTAKQYKVYSYDESGNCISTRTENPDSWETEDFVYEKDELGRLSSRVLISTSSSGEVFRHTENIKYYDNGPILVYDQSIDSYDNLMVFLPNEETRQRLLTCTGLSSANWNVFEYWDGDYANYLFYQDQPICVTARMEYEDHGIGGFLNLPKATLSNDDVNLRLLYSSYYPDGYLNNLLAANNYSEALLTFEQEVQGDVKATFQIADRIYRTYYYDSREEDPITIEFDEEHRVVRDMRGIGKLYTYDDEGRIIGWTSTNRTDAFYIGFLYYDENGKLATLTSEFTDRSTGYRESGYLSVYNDEKKP